MEEPLSDSVITGLYLYYGGNDGRVDTSDKIKYLEKYAIVQPAEVNFAKIIDIALGSEKRSEVPGIIALMLKLSISESGIDSIKSTLDSFQETQFAKFFSDSKFKFSNAVSYVQTAKSCLGLCRAV